MALKPPINHSTVKPHRSPSVIYDPKAIFLRTKALGADSSFQ